MIKCSACILTYNSEKTLEKCLESVKDFSDIVILDGASTDKTLEIAAKYRARVYPQNEDGLAQKITDFTATREKLFSMARKDWIFYIDSDEYLSNEGAKQIKKIVENEDNKNNLYAFLRKAIINAAIVDYAFFYPEWCRRLWNKGADVRLKPNKKVHEDLIAGSGVNIKNIDAAIYHFWSENYKDLIKKDDYYLNIASFDQQVLPVDKKMRKIVINILKASHIFFKSLFIYLKYGLRKTPPILHSWRFVRYHLVYAKKILVS